ncbi:uncharacterized protein LOC144553687 isoform X1 [Carex rostrata]
MYKSWTKMMERLIVFRVQMAIQLIVLRNKQPALDHPLLKDYKIQRLPSQIPSFKDRKMSEIIQQVTWSDNACGKCVTMWPTVPEAWYRSRGDPEEFDTRCAESQIFVPLWKEAS